MIRLLDSHIINQIAAGEVIERPFSAMKELVENAIDAGATKISVTVHNGGQTLLVVEDNGTGMTKEDLELSVERHATSKLHHNDLFRIDTMGFRGEALASIGSVARLTISTKHEQEESGWKISVEGGKKYDSIPCTQQQGTKVEVRDLFFATPARLKFLKSVTSEMSAMVDTLNKLAIAHPHIAFLLKDDKKEFLNYAVHESLSKRLSEVLGQEFIENSLEVYKNIEGVEIKGFISLPTHSRGNRQHQFLFVNQRPITDVTISNAIRVAYRDLLSSDRYPILALFLNIDAEEIDVNVHPTKSEIRFQDSYLIKNILLSVLKNTLALGSSKTASSVSESMLQKFNPSVVPFERRLTSSFNGPSRENHLPNWSNVFLQTAPSAKPISENVRPVFFENSFSEEERPLGHAKAQLHNTYIVAEKKNSLVIVDQHAAHERLTYEKMKKEFHEKSFTRQVLMIPEVIDLKVEEVALLAEYQSHFLKFGIVLQPFGERAVIIKEVPSILGNQPLKRIIPEILENLKNFDGDETIENRINEILSSVSCHGSVRAGQSLSIVEMNALLREMEQTAFSGQCNHGRPTYIELQLKDIEKLFGRT